jgi:hypothetical protein
LEHCVPHLKWIFVLGKSEANIQISNTSFDSTLNLFEVSPLYVTPIKPQIPHTSSTIALPPPCKIAQCSHLYLLKKLRYQKLFLSEEILPLPLTYLNEIKIELAGPLLASSKFLKFPFYLWRAFEQLFSNYVKNVRTHQQIFFLKSVTDHSLTFPII